jgi:dynein heavy chain
MWCSSTELMLKDGEEAKEGLEWWYHENINMLTELTKIVSRPDIDSIKRKTVVALITQDVHYRDILEELIEEEVESIHEFKW